MQFVPFCIPYEKNKDVIQAFCENWCHKTNTLHLAYGEALWDLYQLGSLLFNGQFYEEVILTAAELTSASDRARFLPK